MRKIFNLLLFSLLLAIIASPVMVVAVDRPIQSCKLKHDIEVDGVAKTAGTVVHATTTSNWALFCSLDAIQTVADLVSAVAIILSGVVLLAAAILFFTAAGTPERIKKAKTFFFWGLVGVAIIALSKFIPAFARFFLGI